MDLHLLSSVLTILGIPANTGALLYAFWIIDRRLVRIETELRLERKAAL